MIKILADTSALVSLEIKHLVALSSKIIQFYISDRVRSELKFLRLQNLEDMII